MQTQDLAFAAYLTTVGFRAKVTSDYKTKACTFEFEDLKGVTESSLQELKGNYDAGRLTVEPLAYYNALSNLKSKIHDAKRI